MFVFAYRADPRILAAVASGSRTDLDLMPILLRANDRSRARAAGLHLPSVTRSPRGGLTPRERDVFELLCDGRTNREIAGALFLSEVTVKVHVRNILRKLGVRTRTEAAVLGVTTPLP
jgi:DNA-binding NarL/FixJ family response regulator